MIKFERTDTDLTISIENFFGVIQGVSDLMSNFQEKMSRHFELIHLAHSSGVVPSYIENAPNHEEG